ncbi:TetR/AcrR family transcriptional regulator C-terminal domain-containing protein [Actinoallomurus vinaceus]|uniref:TetR/AcrR family transcriptional regulator C-terminal domain-containing protein n=1 Tax=Actinoallomurus vinaceus TaxID=1080074 RepID=A0ABP8U5J6_9ACTN
MTEGPVRSIWLRPERGARGPAPEYSRGRIATAGVALADADGLAAVTMRAVADALGTGPASLYRYVATRDELIELMINEVNGEFDHTAPGGGHWLQDLLALARQSRGIYLRHPWLLDATGLDGPIGPNAVDYLEHALAALSGVDVDPRTKLEAIGVLNGLVALLARAEIAQGTAGRTLPQWQREQTAYLSEALKAGRHPHLAAALATRPPEAEPAESLFDRVVARVLTGLLHPGTPR